MTIEDKNIVIAEFLGIDVHKLSFLKDPTYVRVILGKEEDFDWDSIHDFDPHRDYNWLMKAWVKFKETNVDLDNFLRKDALCEGLTYWIANGTILEAFEKLYEAINWYNSLKK